MSKNCNEPDFDTLVSKVLGTIPFGIAMMLDEVEENANNINQKEERVKQNTKEHTEGRSYGCSHKCHNPWHKPYLKKFVNLEKETNENSCCQHQQKETVEVGKKYNLRNANYFAKLDEEVRNSEVFQKNVAIYLNQIVEKYASLFSMAKRIEEWASGREVIVYGCGKLGRFLHAMLSLKCNAIVMAFADRDEKLWKNSVQGIPVFSPLEITKAFPDAYYLIAVKSDNETIRHYLMERGIKESHVYWEEVITDTFLLI